MTPARTSLTGYLLLCVLAGLLPLAATDGVGVRAMSGAAVVALVLGYASPAVRGIGVALALVAVGVASGHHTTVVALATGAAVAALCLLLLRWPTRGSGMGAESGAEVRPVLRWLSLELPVGLGLGAGAAVAASTRLPVVVGLLAAAGVLAAIGVARRA